MTSMETVLVTGAAGFIGPQVVKILLQETDYRVVVVDKLTYAARVEQGRPLSLDMVIASLGDEHEIRNRYSFIQRDICDPHIQDIFEAARVDFVINLAAESHVDRSIGETPEFLMTEMLGTHNLLEAIRRQNAGASHHIQRAVFVSTDEVYGSIDRMAGYEGEAWYGLQDDEVREIIAAHQFTERTSLAGGSVYAGCKGGADLLTGAYFNTHKWHPVTGKLDHRRMPLLMTRCVNNFGPFQHPEKLIPQSICTLLMPKVGGYTRRIPIYDRGLAIREWIHTEDHARAIIEALQYGDPGEVYNIGSGKRCRNRDLLRVIFETCREEAQASGFSSLAEASFDATTRGGVARPGHDLCYAVNCEKITQHPRIQWSPVHTDDFEQEIANVVTWYKNHPEWWQPLWTGENFTTYWSRKFKPILDMNHEPFQFYAKQPLTRIPIL